MTSQLRILIVDNTFRARRSMKALLEAWHPIEDIREARNGFEAVQLAEEFHPDIILMDTRMPQMNGLEATRRIKKNWPEIKIILLSLYPDFEAKALAAGADAFVSKSDPPEKLRGSLEEISRDIS